MKSTLVSELTKKYEANVTLYRHGKTVKDQLTKLINEKTKGKTKRKFNICQKSESLKSEKLLRLAQILNKKVNS